MIHDVSWPLDARTTTWPGSDAPRRELLLSHDGNGVEVSRWTIGAHAGTHVDAPSHFLPGGHAIDRLELTPFVGPCRVIDLGHVAGRHVRADDLRTAVPRGTERVLLRTANSDRPADAAFDRDFVALTEDAADWLVASAAVAIGVDGLSVEPFEGGDAVHRRLLGGGVAVIEGLRLGDVAAGPYTLACLPLALVGSDGAPARAALLPALAQDGP